MVEREGGGGGAGYDLGESVDDDREFLFFGDAAEGGGEGGVVGGHEHGSSREERVRC